MHPAIVALSLLPGWCLTPPDLTARLRLPSVLGVSLVVSSAVGLALTALGAFDPWLAVAIECPLLLIPLRRGIAGLSLKAHLSALVCAAAVAVVAMGLAGEPFDADGDAGVYAISAAHLAHTGEWAWDLHEVVPAGIPMNIGAGTAPYAVRWTEVAPGFIVRGNRVVPQFLPGYPVWGAFAATGDGLSGPLVANVLGVVALCVGIAVLARRLAGRVVAWAVPVALAASPLLLVFVRLPTAETFLAGILALWLLAVDVAVRSIDRGAALLAGGLLAVAVTVKFFAWAVVGLAVVWCLFLRGPRLRLVPGLVGPPLVAAAVSVPVAAPHLLNHLRQVLALEAFVAAMAVIALAVSLRLWPRRLGRPVAWTAAVAGAVAFGWLAVVRPVAAETGSENNLVELSSLLGPVLVAGAVVGWVAWVAGRRRTWHVLPALVFGALTLFIAIGSGDSPWYPFAARRALPVTLPLAVLMWASVVADTVRRRTVIAGLLVILPVLPALWRQHEAVAARPGLGFRATRDALMEAVPADTPVLAFGETLRYAPHLALLGDREVASVDDDARRELRTLRRLAADIPDLLLLTDEWRDGGRLAEIEERRERLEILRSPPLRAAEPMHRRFLLVEPSRSERRLTSRLDIGHDDLLRLAGCYRPEAAGDRTIRWTSHRAWILMPAGEAVRFVWSAAGHPTSPVPVEVFVNGRQVARAGVPGPWSTSRWIELPEEPPQCIVELRVPTFSPARQGTASADRRRLGIRLDTVEVRRAGG